MISYTLSTVDNVGHHDEAAHLRYIAPSIADRTPSDGAIVMDRLVRMFEDDDITSLPAPVRRALNDYALSLVTSITWHDQMKIAAFGCAEEGVGELVLTDVENRTEMQVTISADSAVFWLRGDKDRILHEKVPLNAVPFFVTWFQFLLK